ncbi:MAG TPA: EAL domain-containing protein [Beijerinckiaceae bacterium]
MRLIETVTGIGASAAQRRAERAEIEAARANSRLRAAIDALPEGIVFLDAEGRYILWNQTYADIYRRSADLFRPGAKFEDTLREGVARGDYPDAVGREEAWLAERMALLARAQGRVEQRLADGRWILIDERKTGSGETIGIRVDVTDLKQREASFRLLFERNPVAMLLCDAETRRIASINDAALALYGLERDAALDRDWRELLAEETSTPPQDGIRRHRAADGRILEVSVMTQPMTHDGAPRLLVAIVDLTEQRAAEARAAYMAAHDPLTGLANRKTLNDRLHAALARPGAACAALCLDLDHFKSVNDGLGHAVGDALLREVAARIRESLPADALAARLGGDEFAVIAPSADVSHVALMADRVSESLHQPFMIDGQSLTIGASIGVAIAPADGTCADDLLRNADTALYRAKGAERGSVCFFEPGMDAQLHMRRRLEADLRQALRTDAFDLVYQPIFAVCGREPVACEALIRWDHPERGRISPSDFSPIAEETGLIDEIGAWALRRACAEAAHWPEHVTLAVNVSPTQFRRGNLAFAVVAALAESGLPARRLELEITETVMLQSTKVTTGTLERLRALGVRIAMDDFGTGASSLGYLRSFPFDKIKIDQSFIQSLHENRESLAIVRAVTSLAQSLGMSTTAEGVETPEQAEALAREGCDFLQGYLLGRPQSAAQIRELLSAAGRAAVA